MGIRTPFFKAPGSIGKVRKRRVQLAINCISSSGSEYIISDGNRDPIHKTVDDDESLRRGELTDYFPGVWRHARWAAPRLEHYPHEFAYGFARLGAGERQDRIKVLF